MREADTEIVVSSAYINVSPDVIDEGRSFVNNVNKVGPKTDNIPFQLLAQWDVNCESCMTCLGYDRIWNLARISRQESHSLFLGLAKSNITPTSAGGFPQEL